MLSLRTKRGWTRYGRDERGAALAEIAIVMPFIFLLFAAATEFGIYFHKYTTLDKATRAGARYISAKAFDDTNKAAAKNLVLCGSLGACSAGSEVLPGLTLSNIQITGFCASGPCPSAIYVEFVKVEIINFNYNPVIDLGQLTSGSAWVNVPVKPSTTLRGTLTD